MKSLLIFATILGLCLCDMPTCDKHSCTDLGVNECAKVEQGAQQLTFHLKPCKDDEKCQLLFGSTPDICRPAKEVPTSYPGEYCEFNENCYGGNCNVTAKVCLGASSGETCTDDSNCNPRLYCDKEIKKCVDVKKENDACSFSQKCDTHLVCNKGTCVKIGSLKDEIPASAPAACESFYTAKGVCAKGPKLVRDDKDIFPILCPGHCTYKFEDGHEITENCMCGRNDNGDSYCNPGKGDIDLSDVFFMEN